MATIRTETIEYRGYRVEVIEWCGLWQPRLWPLAPGLPADMQMIDAAAPSLEAALAQARQLIDRLLNHPPEADPPPPKTDPEP